MSRVAWEYETPQGGPKVMSHRSRLSTGAVTNCTTSFHCRFVVIRFRKDGCWRLWSAAPVDRVCHSCDSSRMKGGCRLSSLTSLTSHSPTADRVGKLWLTSACSPTESAESEQQHGNWPPSISLHHSAAGAAFPSTTGRKKAKAAGWAAPSPCPRCPPCRVTTICSLAQASAPPC